MPTIHARLRIPLSIWLALLEAAISGRPVPMDITNLQERGM
jgi:hypothetical protein